MNNRKLTLFSRGNFDQTTRISAKVRYTLVSSMNLSYFLDIVLQQSYVHGFHCHGPKLPKNDRTLKNHDWMEIS